MCITDHHDMTLAVKVALNPNPTNESIQLTVGSLIQILCHIAKLVHTSKHIADWSNVYNT